MAIPKKIRREIKISGVTYEYALTGACDVVLFIKNLTTKKTYQDAYEEPGAITPKMIKEIILKNGI